MHSAYNCIHQKLFALSHSVPHAGSMDGEVYTHGHHESVLRSHRWRTAENSAGYLLASLRPGLALLDIGCGPGTITFDLAALVAPGSVTGIDADAGVIAQARQLLPRGTGGPGHN